MSTGKSKAAGGPLRAAYRLISQGLKARRLERLEEREWRRRIMLASRRVQHVLLSMEDEFAEMRQLKAQLLQAPPAPDGMLQIMAASQELLNDLRETVASQQALAMGQGLPQVPMQVSALEKLGIPLEPVSSISPNESGARAPEMNPEVVEAIEAFQRANDENLDLEEFQTIEATPEKVEEEPGPSEAELELTKTLDEERERSLIEEMEMRARQQIAEDRIRELENEVIESRVQRSSEDQLAAHLKDTNDQLGSQIQELQELLEGAELAFDGTELAAEELASSTARVEELEAANQELLGQVDQGRKLASQLSELEGMRDRLRDSQLKNAQLEARHSEEMIQFTDQTNQLASQISDLECMRDKLRDTQMKNVQLEAQHMEEMTEFADHTRQRIKAVEEQLSSSKSELSSIEQERIQALNSAQENERALESLYTRFQALESEKAAMAEATQSLEDIKSLLGQSSVQSEDPSSPISNLMTSVTPGQDEPMEEQNEEHLIFDDLEPLETQEDDSRSV